jgi:signal transduction histidine kinase
VNRPTRRLRTRLLVAMFAIAVGVLVVAALGAAALAQRTSSNAAIRDLRSKSTTVAVEVEAVGRQLRALIGAGRTGLAREECRLIGTTLAISGGSLVSILPDGRVEPGVAGIVGASCARQSGVTTLPKAVTTNDLNPEALLAGDTQTGVAGGTAFLAEPLTANATRTPVLVLTQTVETRPLGRAGPYLIGTGAFALFLAAIVSFILARRLTQPIAAMQTTAGRIAAGDLSARVGKVAGPDDELAGLARSIDGMADELETARGAERGFLLSISHDLRTPLTSIKGYAEAMADGVIEQPADRARAASVILTEARRLERLVADLLDLARLDAHEFSLSPQPVDARAVVGTAVQAFAPAAHDWGVTLLLTRGDPIPAHADPERLGQVVGNLVENALKYAHSSVTVDTVAMNGHVEVRVDDDGPGIAPEERQRVFDRLYTARDTPGRQVGTGIGLAIVHELAGAMGGTATCEPLATGGTRFRVTLPA